MKAYKDIAQRIVNAENSFLDVLMTKGFSQSDSIKAMRTMLKLKVAKLDAVSGTIRVKHGAFLDNSAIQNAVDFIK